jgi:hypothetical protein
LGASPTGNWHSCLPRRYSDILLRQNGERDLPEHVEALRNGERGSPGYPGDKPKGYPLEVPLPSLYKNIKMCERLWTLPCPRSLNTDLAFDALRGTKGLVHHCDHTVLGYLSIRYAERLSEAGIKYIVGSVGDLHDDVLA